MRVKFSVIIPVYNEENYIEKCLSSIISQNFRDYKIIIVDCGSTDQTITLCRKYTSKIIVSETKSVAIQRNIGADEARGDYIVFLDADTLMFDNYFNITSFYLRKYKAFTYSVKFYPYSTKYLLLGVCMNFNFKVNNLLNKGCLVGHNIIIEKNLFFENEKFHNVLLEDVDLSDRIKNKKIQRYITSHSVDTSARKYQSIGILNMVKYWTELSICKKYPKYAKFLRFNKYFDIR